MKTLYLDLFSGISGDMFLGAMLDLGVDFQQLEAGLRQLKLDGYHLHASRGAKCGISGVKFDVHLEADHDHDHDHDHRHGHDHDHSHDHHHDHGHGHGHSHSHSHGHSHGHGHGDTHEHAHEHGRSFAEIRDLIVASELSPWVKDKAVAVFQRIAEAEGRIHGQPPDQVHFHEVGAVDSIVDIVGACLALEALGKPRVKASPVVEGFGWVHCAHGRFPIPAPATLAILGARGIPVSQCEEPAELVTPTGAAILAEFAESFAPMSGLAADRIGFGLGTRDNKTRPNVLRAILSATSQGSAPDWETDRVTVLETNVDDISPEVLGYCLERLLAGGALDVFHTPVQMKKNRPGVLVTVLCAEGQADGLTELLLRETGSFGVRRHETERRKLARRMTTAKTPFGDVEVKLGLLNGVVLHASPEFESCKRVAAEAGVPVKEVYAAALRASPVPGRAGTS